MNFRSFTVAKKLWILSGAMSCALLLVGSLGFWNATALKNTMVEITHQTMPAVRNMTLVDMMHDGIRGAVYSTLLAAEHKDQETALENAKEVEEMTNNITKYMEEISKLSVSSNVRSAIEKSVPNLDAYKIAARETSKLAVEGKIQEANSQLAVFNKQFSELEKSLGELGELIEKDATENSALAEEKSESAKNVSIFVLFASLLAGTILSVWISRNLVKTLTSVSAQLEEQSNLLERNAEEMSSAATQLASGATEQASAVQETAASLEEIGSMVKKTQENAGQLSKIVEHSYKTTADGKENIREMLSAMDSIKESNKQILLQSEQSNKEISEIVAVITEIGEKTKVINDIVFQTKLLSFNASVEAARAGEHGKGFAVVAEEVGNLAQMSGNASREISNMLTQGINRAQGIVSNNTTRVQQTLSQGQETVERGSQVANRCDKLFDQLSEAMKDVSGTTNQITVAIQEQSQGTEEISKAVHMFNESTQQNQAVSVRTSDVAAQLISQARNVSVVMEELKRQVVAEKNKNAQVIPMEKTNKKRRAA